MFKLGTLKQGSSSDANLTETINDLNLNFKFLFKYVFPVASRRDSEFIVLPVQCSRKKIITVQGGLQMFNDNNLKEF